MKTVAWTAFFQLTHSPFVQLACLDLQAPKNVGSLIQEFCAIFIRLKSLPLGCYVRCECFSHIARICCDNTTGGNVVILGYHGHYVVSYACIQSRGTYSVSSGVGMVIYFAFLVFIAIKLMTKIKKKNQFHDFHSSLRFTIRSFDKRFQSKMYDLSRECP